MGSCTAGGAYIPAMSDESIIVKDNGSVFLAGPPLVKAATGEEVTVEELGGAVVHTSISGVIDHLAESEEHALQICRNIFENIPLPKKQVLNRKKPVDPNYPITDLYKILPLSEKESVDIYEIISRITDRSNFQEFKRNYGKTLVTGFAYIMGIPVGIIANNGVLYAEAALKGTHFIDICDQRKIPILFLQHITGFMVGKEVENKGIAKDGAKMVHAVANAGVPKVTIIIGNSFGAGNYAMAGRAFDPGFLFMYPNAKIAVMGGEQAAQVLVEVKNSNNSRKNGSNNGAEELKNSIREKFKEESSCYYSTSRLWDDGIIDPVDTRQIIAMALECMLNKPFEYFNRGIYRM